MKTVKYKEGAKVKVLDCTHSRATERVNEYAIISIVVNDGQLFEYRLLFLDGATDYYNHDELSVITDGVNESKSTIIITNPTFNLLELPKGSLIYVNKGYTQFQGFISEITPHLLILSYYDDEAERPCVSQETVDVDRVASGEYTVELIRKAISLYG